MMLGTLLLAILLSTYDGVYGVFYGETDVIPLCVLAGGLTGILTHRRLQESTEVGEAVSTNTNTNTDPCAGNECGGQGECLASFCNCSSGFCGPNCEKSEQETWQACPCKIRFSVCVENTCVCECGFTFLLGLDLCVKVALLDTWMIFLLSTILLLKNCSKGFADTFTLFDGFELIVDQIGLIGIDEVTTLEELRTVCNNLCRDNQFCRAYVIDTDNFECGFFLVSKDDTGLRAKNNFELYERDCIDEMS